MRHIPNIFCLSRIILTVPVALFVLVDRPWSFLVALGLFLLGAVTDIFDGYSARRLGLASPTGVFLDLTADKVFVSCTLIVLIQVAVVPAWAVIIIVAREFLVTGMRSMAQTKGKVIPAGKWGKLKMAFTWPAISALLLAKGLGAHQLSLFPLMLVFNTQTLQASELLLLVGEILLLCAVLWTVFSGAEYIIGSIPLFQVRSGTST